MNSVPSAAAIPALPASSEIVRDPNLLITLVGEDAVIFDVRQDRYFSLDAIGASIWQRLEKPATIDDLCDELLLEYEAPRAVIEADLRALLHDLIAGELVRAGAA